MAEQRSIIPIERIDRRILQVRGQRILIAADLAELYGVTTKALNQAVKRNAERFPVDFAFRLTKAERAEVVTNCDHLARLRYSSALPFVFTEHGAVMAANVLNSRSAVKASVVVVRAFVRLREVLATHRDLARKLIELEQRVGSHDGDLRALVIAIRTLADPWAARRRERIGFHPRRKTGRVRNRS